MCDTTSEKYRVADYTPRYINFGENDIEIFEAFLGRFCINNYVFDKYTLKFEIKKFKFLIIKLLSNKRCGPVYVEMNIRLLSDISISPMPINEFLIYLEKKIKYIQETDKTIGVTDQRSVK